MTKDAFASIKGLQSVEAEEETVEMIAPGIYFERDGKHYIKYDEAVEGTEETIQNLIKVDGSSMEVTKRGVTNAHMVFERNKKIILIIVPLLGICWWVFPLRILC